MWKDILKKLDIIKDDHHHHHCHGEMSHADVKLYKLIIGVLVLPLALIYLPNQLGANINLPNLFYNPWWMFGWSTFIFLLIGSDYIPPAIKDIKNRNVSVTIFVAMSSWTAYIYSVVMFGLEYESLIQGTSNIKLFFDSVIEILVIIYIGNYVEEKFSSTTQKGLESIIALYSKEAILLKNKKEIIIDPKELKIGDIILVRNGEKIPIDGIIEKGKIDIIEAVFTGESIPVTKDIGSKVIGGTIATATIEVKVTSTLENSMLSQVIKGIENTREQKVKTSKIAQTLGKYLLPLIFVSSIGALIGHSISGGSNEGIKVFITTLIVTCPMSLILLTPTATLVSSSIAAKKGIVFNSSDILERVKKVDAIAFDKTGTLTEGKLSVVTNTINKKYYELIKSIEYKSNHPIAKAIVEAIPDVKIYDIKVNDKIGQGLNAEFKGTTYYVGSYNYLKTFHKKHELTKDMITKKEGGSVIVYIWTKKEIIGYIELKDKIKKTAIEVIKKLNKMNIEVFMITGDNNYTAQYVAKEVGIKGTHIYSEILPTGKAQIIRELQEEGKFVAFTGDGINDAIALEQSNIGISIGDGSSIAIDSSDITIQKKDLHLILESLWISNQTLKTIYFGLGIAILYNLIVLSIAVSGLLLPAFGAISMIINDTMPIFISLTLYRLKKSKYKRDNIIKKQIVN